MMKTVGSQITQTTIDDLTERIMIMYRPKSRNKRGDIIQGDSKIRCRCFAKIYPYQARNQDDSSIELQNMVNYRVVTRYRDDIQPDDFILWRDKILKMRSPPYDAESRHIFTIFECVEVISDGRTQ